MINIFSVIRCKLPRLFINFSTSGKFNGKENDVLSDYIMRYVLMNFISLFGSIVLLGFTFENFWLGRYASAITCVVMTVVCALSILVARTKIRQIVPALMLVVFYALLCMMVTFKGEAAGANFLFIYIYPPLTIMLLGMAVGTAFSFALVLLISLEMFVPDLSKFAYTFDFSIRMLATYLLSYLIIMVIESTRKTKDYMIAKQNKKLEALNDRLTVMSTTDELTKLRNRRSFLEYIDLIWKQSHRLKMPLTVLMIDIDYFKRYNDSLGHFEGDKALIAVAQCMKNHLRRETDFIARFGGEEFVCLLPYTESKDAVAFASRLVKSVEDMRMPHPANAASDFITISAGLAHATPDNTNSWNQLLADADKALYKAKESGRNCVMNSVTFYTCSNPAKSCI